MASDASRLQGYPHKPRVFIISDISNEPDDAESLVRYLLYSNQFETEGLVACTSTWMRTKVCPQDMHKIIDAYGEVEDNLNKHAHPSSPYPKAQYLKSLIKSGPPVYGFKAVGDDVPLSEGGELLLGRLKATKTEPLWILCWGGTNVLAQALFKMQSTVSEEEFAAIRSKLRVYAISDQDDTGAWIRASFPDIHYIVSIHGWNQYGMAAWTGISGDKYYGFDVGGPDFTKISPEWIKENIQLGKLGQAYPDYMFIPEGDTPTFLYLIQNGLGVPEEPDYGSWGGRYSLSDCSSDGLNGKHYGDATDIVVGKDGREHRSSQATIWRWRDTFQNDFAARIRWTLSPSLSSANHHPVIALNGVFGTAPVFLSAEAGSTLRFDATGTYDPDGDDLTFKWWHYREPSARHWGVFIDVAEVEIEKKDEAGKVVDITLPGPEKCCLELLSRQAQELGQKMHIILEVTDNGAPSLTSYRRIVIQTTNKELKGGQPPVEAIGDLPH